MSKLYKFSVLLLIIIFNTAQINAQEKKVSVADMNSDIDFLINNINAIHINPYYKFKKEDFKNEILQLKNNLKNEKNIYEFWEYIAPTVAKMDDGHTYVNIPYDDFNKLNPKVFPFKIKTSLKKPFIKIVDGNEEIPKNVEIISINGVPSQKIIYNLIRYISGEDKKTRAEWIAYDFSFLTYIVLNLRNTCTIKYRIKNREISKKIDFIYLKEIYKKNISSPAPYSLKILPKINTAIIDFKSFSNPSKMKTFADSTFTLIKNKKISNLIIDIRENGGGNSRVGDNLLQYLAKTDFRQYTDSTIIKVSKELYQKIRAEKEEILQSKIHTTNDSIYLTQIDKILNEPIGTTTIAHYAKNITKLEEHKNRFMGNLFLLTSRVTYSSASDFAQTVKAYNLGKIVGEETGGWIACYGDSIDTNLPNSNLTLSVSSVKFVNEGANPNDWHGVKPDIEIKQEKALEYVLKYIKTKNKNNCR